MTVDRCNLEDKVETVEEFLDSFCTAVVKLLRHHFVSKKQAIFCKKTKNNLELDEGLLVMDFSENYSFIVQDAAQGYHWENSQCTLHPFVFYFKMQDSTIGHESFCFISDSTKHSTAMVYTFLKKLIPHLKKAHDQIRKIIYFSDGCAAQYKNRYSFINLIHHYEDFGLKAEWNFFTTSHGKNACDGIGGTLKRSAARASLQRPLNDQILTPMDFYHYCQESISTITTYYTRAEEVEEVQKLLAPRFELATTIVGTQRHHRFQPISSTELKIYQVSESSSNHNSAVVKITSNTTMTPPLQSTAPTIPNISYVCVEEGGKKWIAQVVCFDKEFQDYLIQFLHPPGLRQAYWFPDDELEQCFKSHEQILGVLPEPRLTGGSRIRYVFSSQHLKALM